MRRSIVFPAIVLGVSMAVLTIGSEEEKEKSAETAVPAVAKTYKSKCAFCHGDEGDGSGPSGKFLKPPPSDFTDDEWKHGGKIEDIISVISNGVEGTAMVGFSKVLSEEDIKALAEYVKNFSAAGEEGEKTAEAEEEGKEAEE